MLSVISFNKILATGEFVNGAAGLVSVVGQPTSQGAWLFNAQPILNLSSGNNYPIPVL